MEIYKFISVQYFIVTIFDIYTNYTSLLTHKLYQIFVTEFVLEWKVHLCLLICEICRYRYAWKRHVNTALDNNYVPYYQLLIRHDDIR